MSAPNIHHLPEDTGIEVAFVGRSNAGKSSALNALTQQKSLARTSKTPGRTQLINVFTLDSMRRVIDLPGYGFAQVPLEVKEKWQQSLTEYLHDRNSLRGVVILMDIRHPLKESDRNMVEWAIHHQLSVIVLLTKADKLKRGPMMNSVLYVQKELKEFKDNLKVIPFSSTKKTGLDELTIILDEWYTLEAPTSDDNEASNDL